LFGVVLDFKGKANVIIGEYFQHKEVQLHYTNNLELFLENIQ